MRHQMVHAFTASLGWQTPTNIPGFARGTLSDPAMAKRLMTPYQLLRTLEGGNLPRACVQLRSADGKLPQSNYFHAAPPADRDVINMEVVGDTLNRGGTLIAGDLHHFSPVLTVLCRALSWLTDARVGVNAYLTVGSTSAFKIHYDTHDVLVVQVSGHKHWEVRGQTMPAPVGKPYAVPRGEPSEDILWSGTVSPGDVMLIPRGNWHVASRVQEEGPGHSLHLTFGIHKLTGLDWITTLAKRAAAELPFRLDLDHPDHDQTDRPDTLVDHLARIAREVTPARAAEFIHGNQRVQRHVPYVAGLGEIHMVAAVTRFRPTVEKRDESLVVTGGGKKMTLEFDPGIERRLQILLSGHPVQLPPADTDPLAHRLAHTLIREGLCAVLTKDLSVGYDGMMETLTLTSP
ncbi:JmjC domain-containing protein [Streptomyces sp. MMBL 11-3]|uniref:JmjC domain-containing protein n=1 Tax=Streptomyces sp. MMBL 11-3 TaxID=3382639 RepID=UPI0039B69CA9